MGKERVAMILIVVTGFTEIKRSHLIVNIQVDWLSHCSDALCMRGIRIVMKRDHFGVRPYTVSSFLSPIKQGLKFF